VTDTQAASSTGRTDPVKPAAASVEVKVNEDEEPELCAGDIEELVQDMEHLQLGTEEAWFLSSALGVLKVYDPVTVSSPLIPKFLLLSQAFAAALSLGLTTRFRFADPRRRPIHRSQHY
jgi:tRNA-splicing endonuclease subunit Sen2